MKIIIVDDEVNALNAFLNQIITKEKVEYHFFKDDAPSIVKYCKSNYVDGAFLDINMPGINGFDLARE
nr:response regulator [Bacilli bacterium]